MKKVVICVGALLVAFGVASTRASDAPAASSPQVVSETLSPMTIMPTAQLPIERYDAV